MVDNKMISKVLKNDEKLNEFLMNHIKENGYEFTIETICLISVYYNVYTYWSDDE